MFKWNENDNIMKIDTNLVKQVKCVMKTIKSSKYIIDY